MKHNIEQISIKGAAYISKVTQNPDSNGIDVKTIVIVNTYIRNLYKMSAPNKSIKIKAIVHTTYRILRKPAV